MYYFLQDLTLSQALEVALDGSSWDPLNNFVVHKGFLISVSQKEYVNKKSILHLNKFFCHK